MNKTRILIIAAGFMVDYDIKRRLPAPSISLNHRLPDLNKEVFCLY